MSSTSEKYKALIDKLFDQTIEKTIKWQLDSKNNPYTVVGSFPVLLERYEDAEGTPYIRLSIFQDQNDNPIDTFNDASLANYAPGDQTYSSYWNLMNELVEIAIRQAKGADQAIDEILKSLG